MKLDNERKKKKKKHRIIQNRPDSAIFVPGQNTKLHQGKFSMYQD